MNNFFPYMKINIDFKKYTFELLQKICKKNYDIICINNCKEIIK